LSSLIRIPHSFIDRSQSITITRWHEAMALPVGKQIAK
jgi:hypothetical protein